MKIKNLFIVIFLSTLLIGCASNPSFRTIDYFPQQNKTIVLLEPDVELSEMTVGGILIPKAEWTKKAIKNLNRALDSRINAIRGNIRRIDSDATIDDREVQLVKTLSAMGLSVLFYNGQNALPTKKGNNQWSMGKELNVLRDKHQADYALLFYVRDQFTSQARQATKIIAAIFGIQMAAAIQTSYAAIVDLNTGKIVWFNYILKTTGDTRTTEGAQEMIKELMKDMPS